MVVRLSSPAAWTKAASLSAKRLCLKHSFGIGIVEGSGLARVVRFTWTGEWSLMPSPCRTAGSCRTEVQIDREIKAEGVKEVSILSCLPNEKILCL